MAEAAPLLARLDALDALVLDPEGDLEALLDGLRKRQVLLDEVQKADIEGLPQALRDDVRGRLEQLHADTRAALSALGARRRAMVTQKEQVVTARHAARGYRPDNPKKSRSIDTKA